MIWLAWTLDILAVLLSVGAFVLNKREQKAYRREEELFDSLCILSIIIGAFQLIERSTTHGAPLESLGYVALIVIFFYDIFDIVLLFVWILFVDFMIYRSEDHIRYLKPGIIKIIGGITVVEMILTVIALCTVYLVDESANIDRYPSIMIWTIVSYYLIKLVEIVLLFVSIIALARFRRRRKGPMTFRGMPFYIPVFFGCVLTIAFHYAIDLNAIGIGLGVFLLYFSMRDERRYIDYETGFFSMEYLVFLSRVEKKRSYDGGIGMLIMADEALPMLIEILKRAQPEGIDIVRAANGTFFLVGERKSKMLLELFLQNVRETAAEEGIELKTAYGIRDNGESAEELFTRLTEAVVV